MISESPEIEHLSDLVVSRLTGRIAECQAERQVLGRLREIGLSGVHAKSWTLPRSWHRGPRTTFLVTQHTFPVPVAAYGSTGSTPRHSDPS
jgi:hypothetical protein